MPCRILGDPLQAIFGFRDNKIVDWAANVEMEFASLSGPSDPWRWRGRNEALGEWLGEVRERLLNEDDLDFQRGPVRWFSAGSANERQQIERKILLELRKNAFAGERIIAIKPWPNQCYALAKTLHGTYSCVEAIDAKDLYHHAAALSASTGCARAAALIDFASACMTKVGSELKSVREALRKGKTPRSKKHSEQREKLLQVAESSDVGNLEVALRSLSRIPDARVYRRELLREMVRAIREVEAGLADDLSEAAWVVRDRTRRVGRRLADCTLGTTLLVKGLEFDHAVVFDGEKYDARNLYVALTRGSRSLTVVSDSPRFRPEMRSIQHWL